MTLRTVQSALAALALAAFVGCSDDLTVEKGEWDTATQAWNTRLDALKKGQADLAAKVKALPAPLAGTEEDRAALDKTVKNAEGALADADKALTAAKASIDAAIAAGNKTRMQVAVSGAKKTVDGPLAQAESLVNAGGTAIDALTKKTAEVEKVKARADAFAKSGAEAVKKKGNTFDVELHWTVAALDAEKSKLFLGALATVLKSCADLKVDLAVVATGDAADLGTKRVEALKTWLTGNGVDAKAFGATTGTVEQDGEAKVTVTVANACK